MPKPYVITAPNLAGGTDVTRGEKNLKPNQNVSAVNMRYTPDGLIETAPGYAPVAAWDFAQAGNGVDGLGIAPNYPDLVFTAVNGKIFLADGESGTPYNVDTGLSLTAGNPVFMREYRGNLYFANGVDNMGRVAIGRLSAAVLAAAGTWSLRKDEGYRFTNGADKVYCEGDEADYTAVSTDDLTTVTNGLAHASGAYVTQYKTLTAPPSGSLKARCMAFFRSTMFYIPADEANVLRYSKTIASLATVGNVHDFSDGENYMIGDGGELTALHASRDRIYVFMKDKTHYITTTLNSSGVEDFSVDRLFTPLYGCPNPFCVTEMEDMTVFFTGTRLIRIGYAPQTDQLLPDEKFDADIVGALRGADEDQSEARLVYNPRTKLLQLTFRKGGVLTSLCYNLDAKVFSYPDDHAPSCYLVYKGHTLFGNPDDDDVFKVGSDLNANEVEMPHSVTTGRLENDKGRVTSRFLRGYVDGYIARGTKIVLYVYVNNRVVGGARYITDAYAELNDAVSTPHGADATGDVAVGDGGPVTLLYPFKYNFLISAVGEDVRLRFGSLQDAAAWAIENYSVEALAYDTSPYTSH